MNFLFDPKIFNYVIMSLYTLNACRWAVHGGWTDCFYWLFALGITACVTWGYTR